MKKLNIPSKYFLEERDRFIKDITNFAKKGELQGFAFIYEKEDDMLAIFSSSTIPQNGSYGAILIDKALKNMEEEDKLPFLETIFSKIQANNNINMPKNFAADAIKSDINKKLVEEILGAIKEEDSKNESHA